MINDEEARGTAPALRENQLTGSDASKGDAVRELVELRIPGRCEYIGVAREAVAAVAEQLHLSRDDRAAVKLAVGEACNNAVFHARRNCPDSSGCVIIACRLLTPDDLLEIDVTNQGNGFHPEHPAPMPEAEVLAEHGRGLPLMEMLVDSVEYLSRNGNTTVRLRKKYTPESAASAAEEQQQHTPERILEAVG